MGYWHDMTGWDYFWMVGLMVLWVVILVGGVWAAVAYFRRGSEPARGSTSARDELDRRLAAGEITEEEYTRRRDLIRSSR